MLYPNPGPQRPQALDLAVAVEAIAAFMFALLAGTAWDAATIAAAFAATSAQTEMA
jgi:hypothetical protein